MLRGLALAVMLLSMPVAAAGTTKADAVVGLLARDDPRAALEILDGFDWKRDATPQNVRLLSAALSADGARDVPSRISRLMPSHALAFARGYLMLLSGRPNSASAAFADLQGRGGAVAAAWGSMGLLEIAVYADNVLLMPEPLRRLSESGRLPEERAYFELERAFRLGDYARATALAAREWRERRREAQVIEVELRMRTGRPLNPPRNAATEDFAVRMMRARAILQEKGPEAYRRALDELRRDYPRSIDMKIDALSNDLFSGERDRKSVMRDLLAMLDESLHDLPVSLYIANLVVESGDHEDRLHAIRAIQSVPERPRDFSRYHLLECKVLRGAGKYSQARTAFELALAMAPASAEVLREGAILFRQAGDLAMARDIMAKALEIEPESSDAMVALADIEADLGNVERARALVARARSSSRFVDPAALERVAAKVAGLKP